MSQELRQHQVVPGRLPQYQAYVPDWSPIFDESALDREVKNRGIGLGFTVRQVLPERRWAIDPETGECMDQRDFEERYKLYISLTVSGGSVVSVQKNNRYFDPSVAPIPGVSGFVGAALDWQGKEIAIGFDPDKPATVKETEVKVYNHEGEEVSNEAGLKPAAVSAKLETLTELLSDGTIDAEEFAKRTQALVKSKAAPGQTAVEPPPNFKMAEPVDPEKLACGVCGKVAKSMAGKAAHERHCTGEATAA